MKKLAALLLTVCLVLPIGFGLTEKKAKAAELIIGTEGSYDVVVYGASSAGITSAVDDGLVDLQRVQPRQKEDHDGADAQRQRDRRQTGGRGRPADLAKQLCGRPYEFRPRRDRYRKQKRRRRDHVGIL